MAEIVRLLRVVEYVGPRDQVDRQIAQGFGHNWARKIGGVTIKSVIVDSYPEILAVEPEPEPVDDDIPF